MKTSTIIWIIVIAIIVYLIFDYQSRGIVFRNIIPRYNFGGVPNKYYEGYEYLFPSPNLTLMS